MHWLACSLRLGTESNPAYVARGIASVQVWTGMLRGCIVCDRIINAWYLMADAL
jgi:hypothetical protein